jgi:hypothetical protein
MTEDDVFNAKVTLAAMAVVIVLVIALALARHIGG